MRICLEQLFQRHLLMGVCLTALHQVHPKPRIYRVTEFNFNSCNIPRNHILTKNNAKCARSSWTSKSCPLGPLFLCCACCSAHFTSETQNPPAPSASTHFSANSVSALRGCYGSRGKGRCLIRVVSSGFFLVNFRKN